MGVYKSVYTRIYIYTFVREKHKQHCQLLLNQRHAAMHRLAQLRDAKKKWKKV